VILVAVVVVTVGAVVGISHLFVFTFQVEGESQEETIERPGGLSSLPLLYK
jgi:hypothetical protein